MREDERCRFRTAVLGAGRGFPSWPHARVQAPAFSEKVKDQRLRRFAERWTPKTGSALLLGPTGAGKSTTAVAAFRRLADEHLVEVEAGRRSESLLCPEWRFLCGATFVRAAELARSLREHPFGDGPPPALQRACGSSLLVLDDLGNDVPGAEATFLEIIDERYAQQRPTIVTSGFLLGQLELRYSEAFLRRLVEPAGVILDVRKGAR